MNILVLLLVTTLHPGDRLPNHPLPVLNAPTSKIDPGARAEAPLTILNFWGTWCSPCIPEMDSLSSLQQRNRGRLRVIAISNEPLPRLTAYLKRKPSGLWLASDTAAYWYRQFALDYVGQAALVDARGRVLAVVRTDSIDQHMIDHAIKGEPIRSSGETGSQAADGFDTDPATAMRITLEGYRPNTTPMGKTYPTGPFKNRRLSWINVGPSILYKDVFDIHSEKQVVYEGTAANAAGRYCFDIVVPEEQRDSLHKLAQAVLNILLPVKGRLEKRTLDVYALQLGPELKIRASDSSGATVAYSGEGFDGTGIPIKTFVDYLSNELDLPVIDETNMKGRYDIHTENVLRSRADVTAGVEKLGLRLEKVKREIDVLVLSK